MPGLVKRQAPLLLQLAQLYLVEAASEYLLVELVRVLQRLVAVPSVAFELVSEHFELLLRAGLPVHEDVVGEALHNIGPSAAVPLSPEVLLRFELGGEVRGHPAALLHLELVVLRRELLVVAHAVVLHLVLGVFPGLEQLIELVQLVFHLLVLFYIVLDGRFGALANLVGLIGLVRMPVDLFPPEYISLAVLSQSGFFYLEFGLSPLILGI